MVGEEKTTIPKASEKKVAEPENTTKESKAKKLKSHQKEFAHNAKNATKASYTDAGTDC